MKSIFKILLAIFILLMVSIFLLGLTFLYSPGMQKGVLLKVLETRPGLEAGVEEVHFGLSSAQIMGLEIKAGDESLRIERLEARFTTSGLIMTSFKLDELVLDGLLLDISATGGETLMEAARVNQPEPVVIGGENEPAPVTVPVEIGKLMGNGSVRLPQDMVLGFDVKLDNIRPGYAGAIGLDLLLEATGEGAPVKAAELSLSGVLNQTQSGQFDRIEGQLEARLLEPNSTEWIEAKLHPRFSGDATAFTGVIKSMTVNKAGIQLFEGQLKATGTRSADTPWLVGYSADMRSDLARVSSLPLFALETPLTRGLIEARISGQFIEGEEATVNGLLQVRSLLPGNYSGRPISVQLEPEVVATFGTDRIEISSSLQAVGPETMTTGNLTLAILPGKDAPYRFEGAVDIDELKPEEWQFLQASLATTRIDSPVNSDEQAGEAAPWSGIEGEGTLRINRLTIRQGSFDDIVAKVSVGAGKSVRTHLAGQTGEASVEALATLNYDAVNAARPYALAGALKVKGLDVAPFLQSPSTSRPVILEGVFDAQGSYQSSASNLGSLQDALIGKFQLKSAGYGTFRPLGQNTSLATGISSLLGALGGGSNQIGWVQEVINQLKEIPFTRMSFTIGREDNLNLFLRDLDLVSRETRIRGEGNLLYREGASLMQYPMDLRFNLYAKGKLAKALANGNQLTSDKPDELGFYPGPPLPLRGSLAEPESLLINLLMDSGTQFLPGLLGPRNLVP